MLFVVIVVIVVVTVSRVWFCFLKHISICLLLFWFLLLALLL